MNLILNKFAIAERAPKCFSCIAPQKRFIEMVGMDKVEGKFLKIIAEDDVLYAGKEFDLPTLNLWMFDIVSYDQDFSK